MSDFYVQRVKKKPNLDKIEWNSFFAFEAYKVKIGIRSDNPEIIEEFRSRLLLLIPTGFTEIEFSKVSHTFSIRWGGKGKKILVYKNEDEIHKFSVKDWKIDLVESHIRMTVAEFADEFVFLHAGAVSYKNKAIIIPARSFSGKTTLVAELASRGLEYYSDEYAVIDKNGLLHPYPKQLSMRGIIDEHQQLDIDVEEYGGKKGYKPINIGLILVSKFIKGAKFKPQLLTSGEGIIESISNSVSIRQNPEFVLKVLGIVVSQAKVIKTNRTEAKRFADKFITYLEKTGI